MKTRTLHRLRRALKKRSAPSTRAKQRAQVLAELDRASQHVKDMAARAVANLTPKEREILRAHSDRTVASNADRFTRIQRRVANHFEERSKEAMTEFLTRPSGFNAGPVPPEPALYPVDPQLDIGPAISPKPSGGALLAAMLTGKKA